MSGTARQPGFVLLLVLAWGLVVAQLLVQHWIETGLTLLRYRRRDAARAAA